MSTRRDIGKREALDWTAASGNPTAIDNLEVLYENDEVVVINHNANNPNNNGVVMTSGAKKVVNFLFGELFDKKSKW